MSETDAAKSIKKLSFEQAMAELDDVVSRLESGSAPLEQSIELYTKGTELKAHCEALLKDAQAKIEKITLDDKGQPAGTVPFDPAD